MRFLRNLVIPKIFDFHNRKNELSYTIKKVFQKLPISKTQSNQLKTIAAGFFSKFPEGIQTEDISGVVIAGFGEEDTFPSLESFIIEGIANNRLKYKVHMHQKIDFETNASIIPFAQQEMVHTFMEGININYRDIEETYLSTLFKDYAEIIVESIGTCDEEEKKKIKEKLIKINRGILDNHRQKLEDYGKKTMLDR